MTVALKRDPPRPNFIYENLSLSPTLSYTITKKLKKFSVAQKSLRVLKHLRFFNDRALFRVLSDRVLSRIISGKVLFRALCDRVLLKALNCRIHFYGLSDRVFFRVLSEKVLFRFLSGRILFRVFSDKLSLVIRPLLGPQSSFFLLCRHFFIKKHKTDSQKHEQIYDRITKYYTDNISHQNKNLRNL